MTWITSFLPPLLSSPPPLPILHGAAQGPLGKRSVSTGPGPGPGCWAHGLECTTSPVPAWGGTDATNASLVIGKPKEGSLALGMGKGGVERRQGESGNSREEVAWEEVRGDVSGTTQVLGTEQGLVLLSDWMPLEGTSSFLWWLPWLLESQDLG